MKRSRVDQIAEAAVAIAIIAAFVAGGLALTAWLAMPSLP